MKNNKFKSGGFYRKSDTEFLAINVTDGRYCANGVLTDLKVEQGDCNDKLNNYIVNVEAEWTNCDKNIDIENNSGIELSYYLSESSEVPDCNQEGWQTETRYIKGLGTYYMYSKDLFCNIGIGKEVIVDKIDKINPEISFNKENKGSHFAITINVNDEGGSGLSENNTYQYCLSTSNNQVGGCTWTDYKNGTALNLNAIEIPQRYLFVKKVKDNAGNYNNEQNEISLGLIDFNELDTEKPILTVNPNSGTYETSTNLIITVSDSGGSGLSDTNVYKYCLSTSSNNRENCEWTNYTSGQPITITGLNQTKYLWVWPIKDNGGNINGNNINVNTPYVVGTYKFISTYTIIYNLNGGSVSGNPTSYNIETNTFTLKNPTRTNYNFIGWTGSNGSSPQTSVSIPKGTTGNKNYTANWQLACTYMPTYTYTGYHQLIDDGNNNWRIKFLTSGNFTLTKSICSSSIDIFLVGGGGGGAAGGNANDFQSGGGAGGGGYVTTSKKVSIAINTPYYIAVGAGGAGGSGSFYAAGGRGGTTSAFSLTAEGGYPGSKDTGGAGGSGGGSGAYLGNTPGAGGSNGSNGITGQFAGGAGNGITTKEFGDAAGTLYAGGGGGGAGSKSYIAGNYGARGAAGGAGGGGAGGDSSNWSGSPGWDAKAGGAGGANTGGGGGGGGANAGGSVSGGAGGTGIVIIRNHR